MAQKPSYIVDAVDHTLMAVTLLTQRETVRLIELADELDIGRATAHRLLRMLVYRDFAMQRSDRSYAAGPVLMAARQRHRVQHLRSWLDPFLHLAHERLEEAVQLQILSGTEVLTLEGLEQSTRHRGTRLPATRASAGMVLLARLPVPTLRARFADLAPQSLTQLERLVETTRSQGYGMTVNLAGPDVVSVSVPVVDLDHQAAAAITCTAPTARLTRAWLAETVETLVAVTDAALVSLHAGLPEPVAAGGAPAVPSRHSSASIGLHSRTG